MASWPRYVVDATVAVKWHLRDEQDTDAADVVLTDFREGRIRLLAPDHIRYEVPNAIATALRTGRLTSDQGAAAIELFLAWRLPTVRDDALIKAAYAHAVRFGCALNDGLYLALADAAGCRLIHADRRLRNTLGAGFAPALWLADYAPHGARPGAP
jgi:predicted nucleic acid-binding protein